VDPRLEKVKGARVQVSTVETEILTIQNLQAQNLKRLQTWSICSLLCLGSGLRNDCNPFCARALTLARRCSNE
jgi:hypothetical protein